MTAITPTAEHFRMEIARFQLRRNDICEVIGMNPNLLTHFVTEARTLPFWAAHNIAYGINVVTGKMIFNVQMDLGVLKPKRQPRPRQPRDPRASVRLPTPKRRRRSRSV